jgi:type II secretory pathway pseudopilin PulG
MKNQNSIKQCARGLVLAELLVVIAVISLLTAVAMLSVTSIFGRKQFEKEAYAIIDVLQKAQNASAETVRRYAVVFDFVEGTYVLRQFATLDMQSIPEEEAVLSVGGFSKYCQLDYVLFDDFMDTRDEGESIGEARFIAGRGGWQYGGKIVLLDVDGNPYSIVVGRLCGDITLRRGDVEILVPVDKSELRF